MSERSRLNKTGIRCALASLALLGGLVEVRSAEALEWEPVEGAQQTISKPEPIKQDIQPGTALNWTSVKSSDATTQEQQGLNWTAVSETNPTEAETINRNIVWEQIHPDDVITEDEIIQISDLEGEPVIAKERPKAYSRGSMIQIGKTVYPNIGMNALQRAPESWVELGVTAIDDTWQWFGEGEPDDCTQGNFLSVCADGLMENRIRVWSSPAFSAELNWTIHSLSGEGAPFSFAIGNNTFGEDDSGTKFGEGQSLGFRIAKNFGNTFGISIGGARLWHLDEITDLSKPFYIRGTKIFRLNDTLEPPIVSLTLGLMTDVYNPDTAIGIVQYPKWLLGGEYPSLFADKYDGKNKRITNGRGYYPNVAGTSSAFVCAEETIFSGKQPTDKNKDCIKKVFVAPIGSVGFAPWPWLGFYANFTRNLNLGISLKPFKKINWNISAHLISPIKGLNSRQDLSIKRNRCPDDTNFSACRTRIGLWTELSF
jgi:hypothetical protein